ncbi:MAG: glutathione S-transferase [Gammaproteobacteria bacterium]|nr:glutathione S-transferase [Gammaproteobacteria bacterium]MBT8149816.1 glutathione S-transferase [Gammaproteobacteria bacterium]NND39567.1 glutathione S-transferase [Pseudomonadales bacterium]NNL11443.1 glutathione S-transferase [Pseudomonadales bacterium]NNM12598.1 glutathione S-transferase [Pseudomonadales bacterium]
MSKPALYMFAISHYCEKGRWTLDYTGIEHDIKYVAPGPHFRLVKKFKLPGSSVPYVVTDHEVVHGTGDIIDWADKHTSNGKTLTPAGEQGDQSREIEKRIDDVIGVHVRRAFYSEMLIEDPGRVKKMLTHNVSLAQKLIVNAIFPKLRKIMIKRMDIGSAQGLESIQILEKEIAWLDELLADGRPFLVGDTFSRADLSAAALLGRTIQPPQHPFYDHLYTPPKLKAVTSEWRSRPSLQWISKLYEQYR